MEHSYPDGKGGFSNLPCSKDEAKYYRQNKYRSGILCPVCNYTDARYVRTDICTHCTRLNVIDLYAYSVGAMRFIVVPDLDNGGDEIETHFSHGGYGNRFINNTYMDEIKQLHELLGGRIPSPHNAATAIEMGLELWVRADPCPRSGHYGIRTLKGHCYFCELERNTPSPRQAAIAAGQTWYIPDTPCKHCGTLAERNVHNGQCKGCITPTVDGRRSPDSIMMEAQPDMIVSRDQARKLGLKVFRTGEPCTRGHVGFRYVSTGSCINCLRNGGK